MEIVTGFGNLASPDRPVVATIGNFDGLHLGHQALLAQVVGEAARRGLHASVVTFNPHPLRVLAPDRAPKMILTRRQKIELLGLYGIDLIVLIPFTEAVASVSAEEFASRFLTGRLHVECLIVGEDFRFGKGRAGDVALLRSLGPRLGFEVRSADLVLDGGARISASQVREAIEAGRPERAAALMGRPYVLIGRVVHGAGRGRVLSFPTANVDPENELIPGPGVYITETLVELEWHPSLTNVGFRPTFGDNDLAIETYLPDFSGSLYGHRIRVRFLERLRDERKFDSVEALQRQIDEDVRRMRERAAAARRAGGTP
jgi:riboflavin kinase/FMN adenylyltransferase